MDHPNALSKRRTPFPGGRTPDEKPGLAYCESRGKTRWGSVRAASEAGAAPALRLCRGCPPWFWPGRRRACVMGLRRRRSCRTMG